MKNQILRIEAHQVVILFQRHELAIRRTAFGGQVFCSPEERWKGDQSEITDEEIEAARRIIREESGLDLTLAYNYIERRQRFRMVV